MRIAFEGQQQSVPWANVMWVRNGNAVTPSQADLDSMVTFIGNAYATALAPSVGSFLIYSQAVATYFAGGGEGLKSTSPQNIVGTGGSTSVTAATAACVSWPIASLYKGGHPRTYIPGIPTAATATMNTLNATWLAALLTRLATFRSSVNGHSVGAFTTAQLGTVSFQHAGQWRTPPIFRAYTAGPFADDRIDTQRRRLGRDR